MSELFRGENISKHFGMYQVLSGISFSVYSGEILGIIGPNGAGKTTLMECMTGLLPFDKGSIYWENQQASPLQVKQFIFYLPDGILPYAEQRVEVVLRFFQRIYGAKKAQSDQLIERLELSTMLKKQVHSLSKGYRRRLLLAIGLLSPQPLLMLDEPFDGFDLRQTLGVMELLRETLVGRTLLLAIHQLTEAEKICDRFLLLNRGKVSAIGSLQQLQQQAGIDSGGLEEVFLAIV
ncbi:MAG: ABC transporter ATP-binding protein [Patescibacteria group bacterium]|nr:ABC transporter ATP-binding protein [Patescibacteria group bacterium]